MERIKNKKFQVLSNQEMFTVSGGGKWVMYRCDVEDLKFCDNGTWSQRTVRTIEIKYNNAGNPVDQRDDR